MLPRALNTPDRLLYPHLRARRDRPLARVSWSLALKTLTQSFRSIIAEYGPDAVAFYGSGQLLTEDYYVANKLAKGFLGTNNFDTNSRLCMASAAAGYHTSLGSDGPPVGYGDIDLADCFFIIGSNTAECHPIVFRRLKRRKEQAPDEVKVISVDPRRTEVADIADLHLPIRPGADIALLNAMLAVMVDERLVDQAFIGAHTQGWDELHALLARYAPEAVQEVCGLGASRIREAARVFGRARTCHQSVEHGREPEHRRRGQKQCPHQPAPGHGTDRQVRRRAVLSHWTAQCHGGACGGRPLALAAGLPVGSGATASSRGGDPMGYPAGTPLGQARLLGGGAVSGARRRKGQSRLDPVHQPRRLHAQTSTSSKRPCARRNWWLCRMLTIRPIPRGLRTCCCRPPSGRKKKG